MKPGSSLFFFTIFEEKKKLNQIEYNEFKREREVVYLFGIYDIIHCSFYSLTTIDAI